MGLVGLSPRGTHNQPTFEAQPSPHPRPRCPPRHSKRWCFSSSPSARQALAPCPTPEDTPEWGRAGPRGSAGPRGWGQRGLGTRQG